MTHLIEIHDLVKTLGPSFRLGPISLTLSPGETLGIMGPNGAGKTTLLRLLWGFLRPDEGRVSVLGHRPHLDQIGLRRKAGFVGDATRFYDWMSVREYLRFVGGFYPTFDPDEARRLIDRLGLLESARIEALSRGGRVKLGLVSALAHRPEVVILDEATSGLDPLVRADVLNLLREMSGRGVGVVLSSHLSNDLDRIADSVLILEGGRIIEYAAADSLLKKYGNHQLDEVFLNAFAETGRPRGPHRA